MTRGRLEGFAPTLLALTPGCLMQRITRYKYVSSNMHSGKHGTMDWHIDPSAVLTISKYAGLAPERNPGSLSFDLSGGTLAANKVHVLAVTQLSSRSGPGD